MRQSRGDGRHRGDLGGGVVSLPDDTKGVVESGRAFRFTQTLRQAQGEDFLLTLILVSSARVHRVVFPMRWRREGRLILGPGSPQLSEAVPSPIH